MTVELQSQYASTIPVVDALVSLQANDRLACEKPVETDLAGAQAIPIRSALSSMFTELSRAVPLFGSSAAHVGFPRSINEHRPAIDAAKSSVWHVLALYSPDLRDVRPVDDAATLAQEQVASLWRLT